MSALPMAIPESERFPGLRELLFQFVETVAAIKAANPLLAQGFPQFFSFLSYPWVLEIAAQSDDQKVFLEQRRRENLALRFNGDEAKKRLEEILSNDKHIRDCCPTLLHLVNFLDSFFVTPVADATLQGASQDQLDFAYSEFENQTYGQGRFKRIALSHLFNFEMDGNSATFSSNDARLNIRLERLDASTIPRILGESGAQAFLHPIGIGNCFVVEEEEASAVDDFTWLVEKRQKALAFAQVLQYLQDWVVHVGYSVPFFQPSWANQIRRSGLFFLGQPRRIPYEGASRRYKIGSAENDKFGKWWKAATSERIVQYIGNKKGKLRQAIYRAGQYYESSHERTDNVERLLALAVAVESLFSPSDKGELKFRISQSTAQLIGKDPEEREEIFKSISKMYDRRSALVHGAYDVDAYDAGEFVTATEIDQWSAYLRRSILAFLALYFRGELQATRDPVLLRIAKANFNDVDGDALRKDADIETVFAELANADAVQ